MDDPIFVAWYARHQSSHIRAKETDERLRVLMNEFASHAQELNEAVDTTYAKRQPKEHVEACEAWNDYVTATMEALRQASDEFRTAWEDLAKYAVEAHTQWPLTEQVRGLMRALVWRTVHDPNSTNASYLRTYNRWEEAAHAFGEIEVRPTLAQPGFTAMLKTAPILRANLLSIEEAHGQAMQKIKRVQDKDAA